MFEERVTTDDFSLSMWLRDFDRKIMQIECGKADHDCDHNHDQQSDTEA